MAQLAHHPSVADTSGMLTPARPIPRDAPVLMPRGVRIVWPWSLRLVFAAYAIVAVVLVWREIEPLVRFQSVDANVVYSEVERVRVPEGAARHRTRYQPLVTYAYEVDGEAFTSAQFAHTGMSTTYGKAGRLARQYVRGTRVQAWYNPSAPRDAVLSRAPNAVLIGLLAFVAFMLWLFGLAVLAIRRHDDARRAAVTATGPPPIG